jgi:FixJ family two-component response regulator
MTDTVVTETVFIVDDDASLREGLSDLLDAAGLRTVCFSSAEDFVEHWTPDMAGCLLLDVRLPGMNGMELQGQIAELGITLPIIIMTAHGDIPMVRKALKAGAVEFLTKPFDGGELLESVRQAFARDRANRRAESQISTIQARLDTLTERERQTLELVTAGLTNKEIGDELHLSIVTVKLHRGNLMRKMRAESLADLVKMWERLSPTDATGSSER